MSASARNISASSGGGSTIPNSIDLIWEKSTTLLLSVLTGSWLTKYASSSAGSRGSEPSLLYGKIGLPMMPAS
jgi:hypothetical protein